MSQVTAGAKMPEGTKESVEALAKYEGKTVSQLIKDALKTYALRQCEIYLIGLDSGALNKVEGVAVNKLRYYRDVASRFEAKHDSIGA